MAIKPMTPQEVDEAIALMDDRVRKQQAEQHFSGDGKVVGIGVFANKLPPVFNQLPDFISEHEATAIGPNIEIDREALAASLKAHEDFQRRNLVGFQNFEMQTPKGPIPVVPSIDGISQMYNILRVDAETLRMTPAKPDLRSKFRKFFDDWSHRVSHAWLALRGHDCD
jgi:hypothetical protein